MGTGKTTVGRLLAAELGYELIDTDDLIQARTGRSIRDVFAELGEMAFRQMEAGIAQELAGRQGLIISTGGRLMLDPANAAALSKSGRVFCLVAMPDEILARLKRDTNHPRPLLEVPDPRGRIVELLREREAGYARFTQVTTSGRPPQEVVDELLRLVRANPGDVPRASGTVD